MVLSCLNGPHEFVYMPEDLKDGALENLLPKSGPEYH